VNRNRMYALLLAALFLFAAAPAMATWVKPEIDGIPVASKDQVVPNNQTDETFADFPLRNAISADVKAAVEKSGGKVYVKQALIEEYLGTNHANMPQQRIPAFRINSADIGAQSGDVVVMHSITSGFAGRTPSELSAVKVRGEGAAKRSSFTRAYTSADLFANGRFAVISSDKKSVLGADDIITSEHYIAFCVKVSGDIVHNYNVGSDDIIDPTFVYAPAPEDPVDPAPMPVAPLIPSSSLPDGVEVATGATSPSSVSEAGLNSSAAAAVVAVSPGPHLVITDAILRDIRSSHSDLDQTVGVKIPVFKASVSADGKTGLVMYQLNISSLLGKKAGNLRVYKARSATQSLLYTFVQSASGLADGTFAILKSDKKTFMQESETLVSGQTYYILLAVADGGLYDSNEAPRVIADPAFVALSEENPLPTPVYPDIPSSSLPEGVEILRNVQYFGTTAGTGLSDAALAIVDVRGFLRLKTARATDILDYYGSGVNADIYGTAPVFKGEITERKVGLKLFALDSGFHNQKAGNLFPVKAVSSSASDSRTFRFVDSAARLADGTFAVLKHNRSTFMRADETLASGGSYYLLIAIKDNGSYDANDALGYISDPCLLTVSTGRSSSSSGGCGIAGFAPGLALMVLPLLLLLGRK